jgi:mannosyltransferase
MIEPRRFDPLSFLHQHIYTLLAALTFLAALMRFYQLGYWSFWTDEVITLNNTIRFFEGGWIPTRFSIYLSPSLWLVAYSVNLLGPTEWGARFAPALIGVISIPILFFVLRRAFHSTGTAFVVVTFITISHWHIFYSQQARYLSALILFYTIALVLFYVAFEEDNLFYLLLSMLFLGLAGIERLFAFFFVPIVLSYLLLLASPWFIRPPGLNKRNLTLFLLPGVITVIPLSWRFLSRPGDWFAIFGRGGGPGPWTIVSQYMGYVSVPLFVLAIVAACYLVLARRSRSGLLFGLGFALPLGAVVVGSLIQFVDVRYTVVSLTSLFIVAALGLRELFEQTKVGTPRLLVLGILVVFLVEPLMGSNWYYNKANPIWPNWRAAYQYVEQHAQPDDIVAAHKMGLANYYLTGPDRLLLEGMVDDFIQSEPPAQRIWFVFDQTLNRYQPHHYQWIESKADRVYQAVGVSVYLYEP